MAGATEGAAVEIWEQISWNSGGKKITFSRERKREEMTYTGSAALCDDFFLWTAHHTFLLVDHLCQARVRLQTECFFPRLHSGYFLSAMVHVCTPLRTVHLLQRLRKPILTFRKVFSHSLSSRAAHNTTHAKRKTPTRHGTSCK